MYKFGNYVEDHAYSNIKGIEMALSDVGSGLGGGHTGSTNLQDAVPGVVKDNMNIILIGAVLYFLLGS